MKIAAAAFLVNLSEETLASVCLWVELKKMTIFFSLCHVHCKLACFCSFIIVGSTPGRMDPLPNQTQHQWHSKNCVHESIRFGKLSFSSHEGRRALSSHVCSVCYLRIVFLALAYREWPTRSILRMLKSRASNSLRNVDPLGQMNYGASGADSLSFAL